MQKTLVGPDQLAGELLAFLGCLHRTGSSDAFAVAAELDLSMSQIRALFVLDRRDDALTLGELAATMAPLSTGAVSRLVEALARSGLVTRTEDAVDRRVKRVAISERGGEAVARIGAARKAEMRELAGRLDDQERADLSRALAPVLARVELHGGSRGAAR